ncbi:ABC transporter permease [Paenibacillus xylaniclasticus]|uniref:ABC transporter permease n=1 Tax=Paenibacillus xylaniclasticus TaxID=588083 RepID=UPI0013DF19D5|nr:MULTISPECIES: ABC-2 family transporter protein [Paenibacillus]
MDFVISLFISLAMTSIGPIVQLLVFTQSNGFPGWNIDQIILFQGNVLIWLGLRGTVFGEVRMQMMDMIRKGTFDRLLMKPYPPIGVLLASGFSLSGLGPFISGMIVTLYAVVHMKLQITAHIVGAMLVMIISGLLVYMGLLALFCCLVIFVVHMEKMDEMFDNIIHVADYPLELFPKLLKYSFIFIIPFAVWAYYPAKTLMGEASSIVYLFFPLSIVFFMVCIKVWNRSLKYYASSGG